MRRSRLEYNNEQHKDLTAAIKAGETGNAEAAEAEYVVDAIFAEQMAGGQGAEVVGH